jgi:DNA-binding ferritin-like protein
LPAKGLERSGEGAFPSLSILLFDFSSFRKEVFFFRSNYQGPDYFDILENISELQVLLDSIIKQLRVKVGGLNKVPYRLLSNSIGFSLEKKTIKVNSDQEGIAMMLVGLNNLIENNRKAANEAEGLEEYFIESLLLEFEKELEKSKWIFNLFSKY